MPRSRMRTSCDAARLAQRRSGARLEIALEVDHVASRAPVFGLVLSLLLLPRRLLYLARPGLAGDGGSQSGGKLTILVVELLDFERVALRAFTQLARKAHHDDDRDDDRGDLEQEQAVAGQKFEHDYLPESATG